MIPANELRIGNYVKDRGGKILKINTIESIHNGEEYVLKVYQRMFVDGKEVHPLTEYSDYLEPLPLDGKWLENCSFERCEFIRFCKPVPCFRNFSFLVIPRNGKYYFDWIGGSTEIKSVHHLQNLYFALHGKELKDFPIYQPI